MQLHNLQYKTKFHKEKRVGRGGKRGTTSGRGTKGQKARAGHRIRPAERDILKRIPKLRGYKFKSFRLKPRVVNFSDLERKFKSGDTISPETLLKSGLIGKIKGRMPEIKILGKGSLTKKFIFKDIDFSNKARLKISVPAREAVRSEPALEEQKADKAKQKHPLAKKVSKKKKYPGAKIRPTIKKAPKSKGPAARAKS